MTDERSVYRDGRDTKPLQEIQAQIRDRITERGPDECWPWTGATWNKGYPKAMMNGFRGSVTRAQALIHGINVEPGEFVARTCGTPECMNPAHLEAARDVNQYRDPDSWASGEENGRSKLTERDVVDIRQAYADQNLVYADLAEAYGISVQNVGIIVRGEGWPDAGGPIKGVDY